MGETTDFDTCKLFVQMRMQGMAERSNASVEVCIRVPYACVGGIGWVIWRPLAEQLWEHAVEELMTGPAGQNPCRPQLLVNMPAEKTEFRERSTTILFNPHSHIQNSWEFRTLACDVRPSGGVLFFLKGNALKGLFGSLLVFFMLCFMSFSYLQWSVAAPRTVLWQMD